MILDGLGEGGEGGDEWGMEDGDDMEVELMGLGGLCVGLVGDELDGFVDEG